MAFVKHRDAVNHSLKYSASAPLAPVKASAAFAAEWRSGPFLALNGNAKSLFLFNFSSNPFTQKSACLFLDISTTTLLWSLEMKVYPAGLLCFEKTNYFLTLTCLSFSRPLNDSLIDFPMFIFSASTQGWQASEIQRDAVSPEDWELESDMASNCEREWMRGNSFPEKSSSAANTHTYLERSIKWSFFTSQLSIKHDVQIVNRERWWEKKPWNTEIETQIKSKLLNK